jgi:hypothetical protein
MILFLLTFLAAAQNSTFIKGASLYESVSSTVASGSNIQLTCSSNMNQRITGSSNQIILLPDATLCSKGRIFNFINDSTGTLTVSDFTASPVSILPAGTEQQLTLYDNSSAPGVFAVGSPAGNRFENAYTNDVANNQSGSNVTLTDISKIGVRLTNASLVSVGGITAGSSGQLLVLTNATGVDLSIINQYSSATAANRIIVGTGSNLDFTADASVWLKYDSNDSRWRVVGGSGGSAISLTGDVTGSGTTSIATTYSGVVPLNKGGTNTAAATANDAFNALSPLTTKGDLVGYSTTNARIPVGADGTVLTADSTQTLGVRFATPASQVSPTVQKFLSGSGTYTTPTSPSPLYIRVRMSGPGGGGGSSGNSAGNNGLSGSGATTFGSSLLSAGAGSGGSWAGQGGGGGTASLGSGPIGLAITGGQGQAGWSASPSGMYSVGGQGGANTFGGSGAGSINTTGFAGATNTGAGGGGSGSNNAVSGNNSGGGGGSGAYIDAIITSPASTYAYSIGTGGTGGGGGTNGFSGGAGADGIIIVEEFY